MGEGEMVGWAAVPDVQAVRRRIASAAIVISPDANIVFTSTQILTVVYEDVLHTVMITGTGIGSHPSKLAAVA